MADIRTDIMADSQTEATLAALDRGEFDDRMRDRVLAALLRSQTRMLQQLVEIKENLWTPERLESLVDRRHQALCLQCPAREGTRRTEPAAAKSSFLETLLSSESIRYFILMLILVWAVIYVKTGPEGTAAVRDAAKSTVLGGGPNG